jgi:eukaryotic-like serine/threonine-protein kinase
MKNLLKKRYFRIFLIVLGSLIVFFLILDNLIMPWYVSSPEAVVPDVVGKDEEAAFNILANAGFNAAISDTSYDVEYAKGTIFLQRPKAFDVVKEGRTIYLFLSGGDRVVHVPILKGKSITDAKFALERIGLKLGHIERVSSNQPEDMIFDQQFAAGTPLKQGEFVGITVSAGRGGGIIVVPDLVGKSLSDAKTILEDSSLVVGKINYQASSTLLPNTVLDQYPSGGNMLNPGQAVDLFITKPTEGSIPRE